MEVMTAFAICMVLLLILLLVGVPLPYCFAGALTFMVATCGIPIKSLFVWGYSQMISTSLMAVPMFIIAGNLTFSMCRLSLARMRSKSLSKSLQALASMR